MKKAVFSLVMLCVPALAGLGLWRGYLAFRPLSGEELNRAAWEATFRERGLPVPPHGQGVKVGSFAASAQVSNAMAG